MSGTKKGDREIPEAPAPGSGMPWVEIDRLGDTPFMPEGREQPELPEDRANNEAVAAEPAAHPPRISAPRSPPPPRPLTRCSTAL
jgi:hypothetical protein